MSKFSVKKPYTILVGVIMILVLGFVSFTDMTTDLLPTMSLPYLLVITTDPGASPESVEINVTEPLESALGTVSGVENVSSRSSENYSMIIMEFAADTNMDSAMVKVSSQLDLLTLPDGCGNPMVIEMSPDMLATMMVTVDYDGKDIYELTDFVQENVVPELERQEGVASVDANGLVEKYLEVRLNQDKIDDVNLKLVAKVNKTLADSAKELKDARKELEEAQEELKDGKKKLEKEQKKTSKQLGEFSMLMNQALATQVAYQANLTTLQANQAALQMEKDARKQGSDAADAAIREIYKAAYDAASASLPLINETEVKANLLNVQLGMMGEEERTELEVPDSVDASDKETVDSVWEILCSSSAKRKKDLNSGLSAAMSINDGAMDIVTGLPKNLSDALANNGIKLEVLKQFLAENGQAEAAAQLDYVTLKENQTRLQDVDVELGNLNTEITAAQMALDQVNAAVEQATKHYAEVEAGKITAAAAFGAYTAQMNSGEAQIEAGLKQLDDAEEQLREAKKTALKNANLDQLLTMSTLSGILIAENFDMPAGYIKNDDEQYLLKVGEKYESVDALEGAVLTHIDDIGDVTLSDVADIVVLDNAGESYTKVNGNEAIMISITKSSTAGTSAVAERCNKAMAKMEEKYEGLHFTSMMDQGEYIGLIIHSVLSNLIWGAGLAFLVLLLFLQDLIPTLVVAISIPLSVLFAVVLMYFTDITLNIISLSGLALGVGMLVDNSVVVMENIYRMRGQGVPSARAAVKGAKQVTGSIVASTLTTVCVFLPIVFTSGLARQLFTDMGLTIAYSLGASVIVALTVVPAVSATLLRKSREKQHPWFDKMLNLYEVALRFCLKVKLVPIVVALVLLAFCGKKATEMGLILIPSMGGTQMSMTMTAPDGCSKEDSYAKADDFMMMASKLPGMETVGIMDGGSASSAILSGGGSGRSSSSRFTVYLVIDEETANDTTEIEDSIEKYFEGSDWEYSLSTSNMDMGSMMSSGMSIRIEGRDLDRLMELSDDMMKLLGEVEGFEEITNGQEESDDTYKVVVSKEKAMRKNLTVAQIYQQIAGALTTDTTSTTLVVEDEEYVVHIVDEREPVSLENLMDMEFETTTMNDKGEQETETSYLSDFCELIQTPGVKSIARQNQVRYITVSAKTMEGYNTTLLSREVKEKLDDYVAPDGYKISITGESEDVMDAMMDLLKMIALACVFIYMIMVAQFQSLRSPFIVIFTVPLAFTGGLLALLISREELSMIAMMGFLVLSGVVVNNGIVFVDYANQLRLAGIEKREALVRTGKTRMRPILMTALTTILAMCTMAFDQSFSGAMGRGMAIVTIGGLTYATLMTLFIVPVLYDLMYRGEMKQVDLGDLETLDDDNVL